MSAYAATLCRVPEIPTDFWLVVGVFVENEAARNGMTIDSLANRAGLSRQTVSKLKSGEPLGGPSLARIEGALNLPRDLLTYIALGDFNAIDEATEDKDLNRWLQRKLSEARKAQRTLMAVADEGEKEADNPEPHAE